MVFFGRGGGGLLLLLLLLKIWLEVWSWGLELGMGAHMMHLSLSHLVSTRVVS